MSKLTLSVDSKVVARARRYAKQRGVSISSLVSTYLDSVSRPEPDEESDSPILHLLRGILKEPASVGDYRKHLEEKYR